MKITAVEVFDANGKLQPWGLVSLIDILREHGFYRAAALRPDQNGDRMSIAASDSLPQAAACKCWTITEEHVRKCEIELQKEIEAERERWRRHSPLRRLAIRAASRVAGWAMGLNIWLS